MWFHPLALKQRQKRQKCVWEWGPLSAAESAGSEWAEAAWTHTAQTQQTQAAGWAPTSQHTAFFSLLSFLLLLIHFFTIFYLQNSDEFIGSFGGVQELFFYATTGLTHNMGVVDWSTEDEELRLFFYFIVFYFIYQSLLLFWVTGNGRVNYLIFLSVTTF